MPLVPHKYISELGQHRLRYVACSAPSLYLNQHWFIDKWTLRNKVQWILNQNSNSFFHESAVEKIVCEMAVILFKGRWVKWSQFAGIVLHNLPYVAIRSSIWIQMNPESGIFPSSTTITQINTCINHTECSINEIHDKLSDKLHWCIGSYIIRSWSIEVCKICANDAT